MSSINTRKDGTSTTKEKQLCLSPSPTSAAVAVAQGRSSKILRFNMEEMGLAYTDNETSNKYERMKGAKMADTLLEEEQNDDNDNDQDTKDRDDTNNDTDGDKGIDGSLITNMSKLNVVDSSIASTRGFHRRRTLYLIRHGEAEHNVLEKVAQDKAKVEAEKLGLTPEQTWERMEEARKSVLTDPSLRDARLTKRGKKQAREAAVQLEEFVSKGHCHPPTEAMCSPLTRCLQTCQILLKHYEIRAHVRQELQERQTLYPPDTPKSLNELVKSISMESFNEEDDDDDDDDVDDNNDENDNEDDNDVIQSNNAESSSNNERNDSSGHFVLDTTDWKTKSGDAVEEEQSRESKEMLRERASQLFDMLLQMEHRHVLVVSHKGFLRELERGLLELPEEKSPLFKNCEIRVYRVIFTQHDRKLHHLERLV